MKTSLITRLTGPNLLWRIWKKIRFHFFVDQWMVLIARNAEYKSLAWKNFKTLTPPIDRFWADPFVWNRDGKYYLFLEEVPYSTHRGRIICLTLDKELNIESNQVVLEKPYHLSYPFIFEYKSQFYIIPETGGNKRIELYRCVQFPHQWEFEKSLMDDISALDVTLLEAHGKWWLFTYVPQKSKTKWDTLHLFYSDNPLSDQWTPHPKNPIVNDIHSARPAGRIFLEDGRLIRPAQDSSARYGFGVTFSEIITLSETDYVERYDHSFKPSSETSFRATHTYNEMNGVTVIDAILRKWKIFHG
jgi:hypothetical protein